MHGGAVAPAEPGGDVQKPERERQQAKMCRRKTPNHDGIVPEIFRRRSRVYGAA